MLTQAIEVMKYVRASAGRAGISVVFEDINQPRHDGKTIYLPRITDKTTDLELKQLMASVDHEVAHDKFSSFDVLREKEADPKGLLKFVWNFLEDSRINTIEAEEYLGFKQNWDECSSILTEQILSKATKSPVGMPALVTALMCWEGKVSAFNFPQIEMVTSRVTPNKGFIDVLNNYSDRLVHCHSILDKRLGTEATFKLAEDLLKELSEKCKDDMPKQKPEPAEGSKGKSEGKGEATEKAVETTGDSEATEGSAEGTSKSKEDEYKVYEIVLTEEDLNKFSLSIPDDKSGAGKVGINFKPVALTSGRWEMTDYKDFVVIDYPKNIGEDVFLKDNRGTAKEFLENFAENTEPKLISQENFALQVRKLIQIRAKVQRVYGVKKGKLDQSRLSRICFDAPGFNERVFKNKIDNKTLDAAITVLVDMSGSMEGEKAQFAMASTLLVNEVCSVLNVPLEIIGFSDTSYFPGESVPTMFIYKNFSDHRVSSEDLKKYFSLSACHMYGNPDGENILWAYNRLLPRKEKKKLLIVMSDGSPAASRSSLGLEKFTYQIIQEIEKAKKIDIYGLGLLSTSVQTYYTAHSVVYKPQEIPSKLIELIERKVLK